MVATVISKSQSQIILSTLSRYMQPICMIARCAGPTVRRTIPASLRHTCFPQETTHYALLALPLPLPRLQLLLLLLLLLLPLPCSLHSPSLPAVPTRHP